VAPLYRRRGRKLLTLILISLKPAIASQSRVFYWTGPPGQAALKKDKNMNEYYRRVPTEFGPETGFEVKPGPASPFEARREAGLERLKSRLLAERLEECWDPELAGQLRRAASEAAALAWVTRYPLLVFPALFDEKAQEASLRAVRQEQIRQRSRELLAA
jgi:hypothetical protein